MLIKRQKFFSYGQTITTDKLETFFGFFPRYKKRYISKPELEQQVKEFVKNTDINVIAIEDSCRIEEDWYPDLGSFFDQVGGINIVYEENFIKEKNIYT